MQLFRPTLFHFFFLSFFVSIPLVRSQNNIYGEGPVNWELRKPFVMPAEAEKYAGSDLIILSDLTEFFFYSSTKEKVVRSVKYKINTKKGLEQLKHYKMPESFDHAFDKELFQQGRRARINTPYMREYTIKVFAARKFSRQRWANVTVKERYETQRWIKPTGEFSDEQIMVFDLGKMEIGDVLEIYYESYFDAQYGSNIFYFTAPYPKLTCEYDFVYRMDRFTKDPSFILPINIDPANVYTSKVDYDNYYLVTTKIQLGTQDANNYPLNSFESAKMPHVFADFTYFRSMIKYEQNKYLFNRTVKPKNYNWTVSIDTNSKEQIRTYDKQASALRKFLGGLPPAGTDSTNVVFAAALCDTLNNFRYITANQLFYNESALYEHYSGDHLLKRRLAGHSAWKLYQDLFKDARLFYYQVNAQDGRLGEHDPKKHIHFGYENSFIALPFKEGFVYLMPRSDGQKYLFNEVPFYYEDILAAYIPMNVQFAKSKADKIFRMIKTRTSTQAQNTRTENAAVKVSLDSLSARLLIKEELSGQFYTILRPMYLNENIDSTIAPHYFKKCIDKPGATAKKTKPVSGSHEFPFKHVFDCSGKISFKDSARLSLKNWFSFTLSKRTISEAPHYDYYFDFAQEDSYSFLLEFSRPTEITNLQTFAHSVNNDFFELESKITAEKENTYKVEARFIVKKKIIPKDQTNLLTELVESLDQLNNFTLELAKK